MKNKGISLIVLVITIIIMIILAGSIILSLSNNSIIEKAKQAKASSDLSNLRHAASLIESELQIQLSMGENPLEGKTKADYYKDKLTEQGFKLDKYAISNNGNEVIIEQLNVKDIIADGYNVFALLNNDTVLAWGKNNYGHLGVGDLIDKNSPVQIPVGQLSNVKEITVGSSSVYALLNDGTVKTWGRNSSGQLGIGDLVDKSSPVQIPTDKLSDVKQIIAASTSTYALLNDGTVKSWGYNSNGQLGLGDTVNRNTPTQIPGLSNVNKIETGSGRVYAILNDGTVKGWGYNETRFLGFGNNSTAKTSPTDMPQLSNVNSIHVSGSGSFCSAYAVLNDGTMFSWGHNGHRILGFGHTSDIYYPTQIPTNNLSNVKEIHTINFSRLALLKDGTIKSWAYNNPGSLGLGHNSDVSLPTLIPNLSNVKKLSTYYYTAYALLDDGTVKVWGANYDGQLGLGDTNNRNVPTTLNLDKFLR